MSHAAGHIDSANSLNLLQQVRQQLNINDTEHFQVLSELASDRDTLPLIYPTQPETRLIARTLLRDSQASHDKTQLRIPKE